MADPRQRGHAPADPGRPRRAALRALSRRLPHAGGLRAGADRRPSCACGRVWATTGARSTCTGRPLAIVADHGGALPHDERALRALPGVGPYTARAVLAFAFERRRGAPSTPTCVRVLARAVAGDPADRCAEAHEAGRPPACRPGARGSSIRRCSTSGPRCAPRPARGAVTVPSVTNVAGSVAV